MQGVARQKQRAWFRKEPMRWLVLLSLMVCATSASAQLDSTCTVSVLNRSARVPETGAWVLPNVPAGQGPVRARATCVAADGVVRSGQSDLFTVPANGVIKIEDILFDNPIAIPTALELITTETELLAAGQTVQLSALATLPDGTLRDLTSAASGTSYRTSNAAIASVSPEGLVTARASGVVLVSALNEGALAVLRLTVTLTGDSDGDGLPDDFELANGLDPNNPVDALDDPDEDGLSTGQEAQLGTSPFNPDSDGDGLTDGEEVLTRLTDPLLADSDGDQIPDGLEVLAATDPLDPESFSLDGLLDTLEASPSALTLVSNTALGEASQRLQVMATLIDGTVIDIRLRRYGTEYLSSDLAVASFGSDDGRVFAGAAGTAVVTVRNRHLSVGVPIEVESFSPQALSSLSLPGFANAVDLAGQYAYVAAGQAGLLVVDLSDPTQPALVGSLLMAGNANDVQVAGNLAYVAAGSGGLVIVDVSSPSSPQRLGFRATPGAATEVAVSGDRAYVVDEGGLRIFDVGVPTAPTLLGGLDLPGRSRAVAAVDSLAVVGSTGAGIFVVDVSDPGAPLVLGSTHTRQNAQTHVAGLAVRGRTVYVADGADLTLGGLRLIDFQEPRLPVVVGTTSDAFGLTGVAVDRSVVVASDYFFTNTVPLFDVRTTAPLFSGRLDFPGDVNGNDIDAEAGLVVMVGTRAFGVDNGVGPDSGSRLFVGRYALYPQDTGATPPELRLLAPQNGSSVRERRFLRLEAEASDDVAVAQVDFYAGSTLVGSAYAEPFVFEVRVPEGPTVRFRAVATDSAGNSASSDEVEVTVLPDASPTVEWLAPAEGLEYERGATLPIGVTATDDVRVTRVDIFANGELQHSLTAEPYLAELTLPIAWASLELTAVAIDDVGQTVSAVRTVPLRAEEPPLVTVLAPAAGARVFTGSVVAVEVGATAAFGVAGVRLLANGTLLVEDNQPPYELGAVAPAVPGLWRLTVEVEDSRGLVTGVVLDLEVIEPSVDNRVVGRVLGPDLAPIDGARVTCHGRGTESGLDGGFEVAEVVPYAGRVRCVASYFEAGVGQWLGSSASVLPAANGPTDVGEIRLAPFTGYRYAYPQIRESSSAAKVEVADFNGDGRLDIANGTQVWPGEASGRFSTTVYSFPGNLFMVDTPIAVAELTGDNFPDMVVADPGRGRVYIRAGLGNGTFTDLASFATGSFPVATVLADFDGDGLLDVAVANRNAGTVTVLRGLGAGSFQAWQVLAVPRPVALVAADLDGDGDADLAVADATGKAVSIFAGGPSGLTSATQLTFTGTPVSLGLGDLDADGRTDLFVGVGFGTEPTAQDHVQVLRQLSPLDFAAGATFSTGGRPAAMRLADLSGDGTLELVIASQFSSNLVTPHSTLVVFRASDPGTPVCVHGIEPTLRDFVLTDLNNDDRLDLVVGGVLVTFLLGDESGCWQAPELRAPPVPSHYSLSDAIAIDLNGDSLSDRVEVYHTTQAGLPSYLYAYLSAGDGRFVLSEEIEITGFAVYAGSADFNGDDLPDIFVTLSSGAFVTKLFRGEGDGRLSPLGDLPVTTNNGIRAADVDLDGFDDFVYQDTNLLAQERLLVQLGRGDGSFEAPIVAIDFRSIFSFHVDEFTSDGLPDVVASDGADLRVHPGFGNGLFGAGIVSPRAQPGAPTARTNVPADVFLELDSADMNGDGKQDLVKGDVYIGRGDGTFQRLFTGGGIQADMALVDLDLDGDIDIVDGMNGSGASGYYRLLTNDGTGRMTTDYRFFVLQCVGLAAGEFNGDGLPDLMCTQSSDWVRILFHP